METDFTIQFHKLVDWKVAISFSPSAHVHETSRALWPAAAMLFWPAIDATGMEWGVGTG
jgi:hypothetical protein